MYGSTYDGRVNKEIMILHLTLSTIRAELLIFRLTWTSRRSILDRAVLHSINSRSVAQMWPA
jgi:hypothetical protein